MSQKTVIFTDGSSKNNNKKGVKRYGGIGVFFGKDDPRNISEPLEGKVTNQIAELTACIRGLEVLKENGHKGIVYVYTDSKYVIGCMTDWIKLWKQNGWKTKSKKSVMNKELVERLDQLTKECKAVYKYSPAHREEPEDKDSHKHFLWYGNNMADKLAVAGALSGKSK